MNIGHLHQTECVVWYPKSVIENVMKNDIESSLKMTNNIEFNPKMAEIEVFYPSTRQIIRRTAPNAMLKTFHPILVCLHFTGPHPIYNMKSRLEKVLHSFSKYLFALTSIAILVVYFHRMVQEFGKSRFLSFMEVLMRALVGCTVYRNRADFRSLLNTLYSASEGLPRVFILRQMKLKVSVSVFVTFGALVIADALQFTTVFQNFDENRSDYAVTSLLQIGILATDLQIGFFCLYYCTVCDFIKRCCQCIELMFSGSDDEVAYERIIRLYHNISDAVHEVDNRLSFTLFLCILNVMACLFWMGYHFAFNMGSSLKIVSIAMYVVIYSTTLLRVLWAGSTATEAADEVLGKVATLPGILPSKYREIKVMLCRNKNRDRNRLTLWKMFVVRRSLVASIFGGLLTYGIMLGALEDSKD